MTQSEVGQNIILAITLVCLTFVAFMLIKQELEIRKTRKKHKKHSK